MKKHTKVYMQHFNYVLDDFIPCEVCGSRAVDIHHIENRGSGGSSSKDVIENLMAVCRPCHLSHGDVPNKVEWLKTIHKSKIDGYSSY
jgi:5-methylcytosine-specific restriction endonuclease McrA